MASSTTALLCLLLASGLLELVVCQNSSREIACASDPLRWCDFYFLSYRTLVPTFNLSEASGDFVLSSEIWDSQSNGPVSVASVGEIVFICSRDEYFRFIPGNQFYATYSPSSLVARTFNDPWNKEFFESRCVLMFLVGLQITGRQPVWNLDPSDNHTAEYPKARRCVVFKTAPSPPAPTECLTG